MSYPAYPGYKDSGVDWLDQKPSHWTVKRLRHVTDLNPGKSRVRGYDSEMETTFLPMEAVGEDGGLELVATKPLSDVIDGYTFFQEDDVAYAKITPCFENGKAAILRGLKNGIGFGTTELTVLRPYSDHASPDYLFRVITSEPFRSLGESSMYGAGGQKRVPDDFARNFSIPWPPLPEQTQIARFLDHQTARIGALIAEQQRLIELLKEKRDGLALSSYDGDEWQEERLENLVQVIMRPVHQKDGEEYIALGLFNRDRGLFHKEPKEKDDMGDSDFFWVEAGDLILSGQFAWEGAVALAGSLEAGKVVSHRYPIIRGNTETLLTEYLYSLLTTSHGDFLLNENSRGAAGRNRPLNLGSLLKEKVRIPPLSVQRRVADLVHKERAIKLEAECQKKFLLEYRSTLISAAVTGKIDVRDWQPPADESAYDEEVRWSGVETTA